MSLGLDLGMGYKGTMRGCAQPGLPWLPSHDSESWLPWPLFISLCPARVAQG